MDSKVFSFEKENEIKRTRNNRKNLIKWYGANCTDEVFYVGSPDVIDPYSGEPIYLPTQSQLDDIEAREKEAREQMESIRKNGPESIVPEPVESKAPTDDELAIANEIYQRLMAEAAADEAAKQAEIEALKREVEATDADYNAETGSYSGLYGKKPMSQSDSEALENILSSNNSYTKSIEELIKENQTS